MKVTAVVFDLFRTLVPTYSAEGYQDILKRVAVVLSVPFTSFRRLWSETAVARSTGVIPTIEANLEYICKQCGVNADDNKIAAASKIRCDFIASTVKARPEVISILKTIRSNGIKIGLISNCSPETPIIWNGTTFVGLVDVALFSNLVGLRKPDVRIYQHAAERLAVNINECLYVGDGESRELDGAKEAGMHPVLFCLSDKTGAKPATSDGELWHGATIHSLSDIIGLLD